MRKYLKLGLVILIVFMAQTNAEIPRGKIIVSMEGFRNDKGGVHVALFNSANGFPIYQKRAYKVIVTTVKNKTSEVVFTDIPYGVYAVSVLHDENSNNTMDTNWLIRPKEGYAASNNAKARLGPPSFKSAQIELNSEVKAVKIKINY